MGEPGGEAGEGGVGAVASELVKLHGEESIGRVAALRGGLAVRVMKAIRVAGPADIALAGGFAEVADWLLFDTRAPAGMKDALPGGNALSFDWKLIAGTSWPVPWMLSGG